MITAAVILMTICLSVLFVTAYAWLTEDNEPPIPAPVPVRQLSALPDMTAWREFSSWAQDTMDMPVLTA